MPKMSWIPALAVAVVVVRLPHRSFAILVIMVHVGGFIFYRSVLRADWRRNARVAVIPRNVCGRAESSEVYLLRSAARLQKRPGAVRRCAQLPQTSSSRSDHTLIPQTNNSGD